MEDITMEATTEAIKRSTVIMKMTEIMMMDDIDDLIRKKFIALKVRGLMESLSF
jgi:hypothetical protein